MASFRVGEEVLFDGVRYVVASHEPGPAGRLRLLATTPRGTRFVWASPDAVQGIDAYTRALDDTAGFPRRR